ncbi:MAG: hypothetical protein ABL921_08615 [Pirellula sp.]
MRIFMMAIAFVCLCWQDASALAQAEPASESASRSVLVIIGAPGEPVYSETFQQSGERWKSALQATSHFSLIDGTDSSKKGDATDHAKIMDWIANRSESKERWLVFIGHGTSDRDASKFNLRGPDISADELSKQISNQPAKWVIINCASSSGPFINALSGKNRVVITATKSGSEQNYARFGEYLSQSLRDPTADLDHDESISILESFLAASNRVAQFYSNEERLASEQALIDDNGDKKGTPAAFYRGARPVKAPADGLQLDGPMASRVIVSTFGKAPVWTAEQREKIESLELLVEELRKKKNDMNEDDYYQQLEHIFFQIIEART